MWAFHSHRPSEQEGTLICLQCIDKGTEEHCHNNIAYLGSTLEQSHRELAFIPTLLGRVVTWGLWGEGNAGEMGDAKDMYILHNNMKVLNATELDT